ncbi:uncharacterized protein LOC117615004 [Prunus dulcis]|uniref:uncharacterized protein LOC117615004 n=1 Tax=Prunus dulcis TaxID=3755 RepID=UPI001482D415|nr:uncharacterized protein LOC117615004 [Prunus dulcis]
MRIVKKGASLLVLEEPILFTTFQKIHLKRSPPTLHPGSATEKVGPCEPTRKFISIAQIVKAAPPKRFSTPSFTSFKGASNPESHLKHFKSLVILYKAEDALMCKVFAMTLQGAAQDWFHTLPSRSISSFKELAYAFTKGYTSYRTIKKNLDHLYNSRKKPDESFRDYLKGFKVEKANIIECDDRISSSIFKKALPAEHNLYHELTITPSQTLAEVFAATESYVLWDNDRIVTKKSNEQEDQPTKRADQRSDRLGSRDRQMQVAPTRRRFDKGEPH